MTDTGTDTGFERVPPQDTNAEQCVLGGMLLSPDAIADATDILKGSDFYRPAHETIYNAILDLYGRGEPADPITIGDALSKAGTLAKVGGNAYLFTLTSAVPTASNAEYYAEIVRDKAILRRLVEAGVRITRMGQEARGEAREIADAAQAEINGAMDVRADTDMKYVGDGFEEYVNALEHRAQGGAMGVPTGFTDLDALTNGLQPGQVIVVAARPAMGKSTLALDFARSCAIKHGRPAAFFSLEMSDEEIKDRLLSAEARVGLHHLRSGDITDDDWARMATKIPDITACRLTVDVTPNQTVMQIKAKCRRLKQRGGLDLVVIDYMQLLTSGLSSRRNENRQMEVSEMSRAIKLLAKELNIPVVVLSQLNRGPEQRNDKRPVMSDLRESGAIEQDADIVILLHREDAYVKESPRAGEADLIVAKHRNGPGATITLAFQGHYSRFVDMANAC